jgi:carbon-monoxide dehydrogenase medium subunit
MKLRLAAPGTLVDVGRLDLRGVRDGGDHLAIGALTRHHDLHNDPIARWSPASVTPVSPRRPMSTRVPGRASRSFISGSRLCPPAMSFGSSFVRSSSRAWSTDCATS